MSPAILIAETVPLAGFVVAASKRDHADLFLVCYVAAIGILISLAAGLDDLYGLTNVIGLAVGPD
jgi:hypothetical protein